VPQELAVVEKFARGFVEHSQCFVDFVFHAYQA
jgi:hypothetical protein